MAHSNRISACSFVLLALAGCGGTTTTIRPDHPAMAGEARVMAHLPADAMFVMRFDLEALRATTAYEAVSAMPGVSPEVLASYQAVDRIYVSVGPMVAAPGLLIDVDSNQPDDTYDPLADPNELDDETDDVDELDDADEIDDADQADSGEPIDPDDAIAAPVDAITATATPNLPLGMSPIPGIGAGETTEWRRWFGESIPGFMVLVVPHEGSDTCTRLFDEYPSHEDRGLAVAEWEGVAMFRTAEGLCGMTLPSLLDSVRSRRGTRSPAVARLLSEAGPSHDLGLASSASAAGGEMLRSWLASVNPEIPPSERRFVDWLSRVSTAWNRGIIGSASIVRLRNEQYELENIYEYDDERRAGAHEVVADTIREITDVTFEAIAAESEGVVPQGLGDRLRIELEGKRLSLRWTLSEESVAGVIEGLLSPTAAAASSAFAASELAPDTYQLSYLGAAERIESLEPLRAELEANMEMGATSLELLASAYVVRGRFADATVVYELLREYATTHDQPGLQISTAVALSNLAILRGDITAARAEVDRETAACAASSACDGLLRPLVLAEARVARLRGDWGAARAALERARTMTDYSVDMNMQVLAEKVRLEGDAGGVTLALGIVDAASIVLSNDPARGNTFELRAAQVEMMTRMNMAEETEREPIEEMTSAASQVAADSAVAVARARLIACRAQVLHPSPRRIRAICGEALEVAVATHGERHPAVAEAALEVAAYEFAHDGGDIATARLAQAEAALAECAPSHPGFARIAQLRAPPIRRRQPTPRR